MQKKQVDWTALELAYRTGRSFRSLAREFGISSTRIKQVADQENWARDLSAVIAERARAKLNAANLNSNLNGKKPDERAVVEATVQVQTDIVLGHRRDIQRARELVIHLLGQLERKLGKMSSAPHAGACASGEANISSKPATLAAHASTVKALCDALKTLIGLERQAFNVDDAKPQQEPAPAAPHDPRAGFEDLRAAFERRLSQTHNKREAQWVPKGTAEPFH